VIVAADWVTISALATAGGTLVLALATFASVRSANRAARVAEQSLLAGLRPLLVQSRADDAPIKVGFADDKWFRIDGSSAVAEVDGDVVYLAIAVRNVGSGIAVMHGWYVDELRTGAGDHVPLESFRRLTRDIYVAPGEVGFWQGAFRDSTEDGAVRARRLVENRERFSIEVLYGDHALGQRAITRFALTPRDDGRWLAAVSRHWNVDRPER
jgi:hypothetical protein